MDKIQEGRVTVNGRMEREPSTQIDPVKDKVTVDGKVVKPKIYEYILLNKPDGYVTTREDRFAQKTVLDLLPVDLRHLNPVGRLDKNTEGLLILTNDGDLANQLTHPKFDVDKTYLVRIQKPLAPAEKKELEAGILLEGEKTAPAKIEDIRPVKPGCEFLITIHEGRKRQIRLMLAKVGHHVSYLKRIRQGSLILGNLPTGKFRVLSPSEIKSLKGNSNDHN